MQGLKQAARSNGCLECHNSCQLASKFTPLQVGALLRSAHPDCGLDASRLIGHRKENFPRITGQREPPGLRELLPPGALRLASPHQGPLHRLAPQRQERRRHLQRERQQPELLELLELLEQNSGSGQFFRPGISALEYIRGLPRP